MTQPKINQQWLAQRPYLIAIFITLTLILWMASGSMQAQENTTEEATVTEIIPQVKVESLSAELVNDTIELYGRTEPSRVTTLKAEIAGRVEQVIAKRGQFLNKGDDILRLELNDLPDQLAKAQALLKQREIEFEGAKKLAANGFQGQAQFTEAQANLAAIHAEIKRLTLMIDKTTVSAPYDGILNNRYVEQGDYVKSGDQLALIADLNPLIVRAYVTEKQVPDISIGQKAQVRLLNRGEIDGNVRYISSVAEESTNTFKIEIALENNQQNLVAGISSEVLLPLKQVNAIKISPALLALDEQGNIGVKTVVDQHVVFTPINIVKSSSDGIWLTGLGEQADIITLGQGFVRHGDRVEAIFNSANLTE
ncbi:efflux RND transporter periplasmic adaptor subunit [Thalassotalea ganghwensis]